MPLNVCITHYTFPHEKAEFYGFIMLDVAGAQCQENLHHSTFQKHTFQLHMSNGMTLLIPLYWCVAGLTSEYYTV